MLNIKGLNKYYFKHKSNEIHVLNNINLNFQDKGLYFLLGPSGSGKSTLLNTIGLLDNFDSGTITIEDKVIKKYRNVDDIRNIYFGYVFQNYLLNEEISVYDNLAIVLKLINYKGDYYKRIEEVLTSLGMEKYIKRKAKDLSGGQKQRIGIARCLIKSPKIILMDEPTGNLDEKNSIQVMEIAKTLAKDCLIIVVSHDENLATAYGDYIIRLKDGSITSFEVNNNKHDININDLNHIYLKDYKQDNFNNINIYSNATPKDLNIIIDHNKIYIKGSGDIEVINDSSPIKLIDDHRKEVKKEDIHFNIEHIDNKESKHVLPFFKLFKNAFTMKIKKLTKVAFVITSIIFANSIPFLSTLTELDPMQFVETNTNTYQSNDLAEIKDIIPLLSEDDLLIEIRNANALVAFTNKNINNDRVDVLNASYVPKKDNLNIVLGEKDDNVTSIYIDEIIAKRLANQPNIKAYGIFDYKDFLNKEVTFTTTGLKGKITAITNDKEPSIYVDKQLLTLATPFISSEYTYLYEGDKPTLKDNECLLNENYYFGNIDSVRWQGYDVVGYFKSDYNVEYIVNDSEYNKNKYNRYNSYSIYTNDINKFEDELNVKFTNYRDNEVEEFFYVKKTTIISNFTFLAITITISLVFLFFIMKSSLIHRIKEVGINRSIGVKKFDIYKIFGSEIFAIVIKYSLPGFIIMTCINLYLNDGGLLPAFNVLYAPGAIIIYIVLALIIGLIPVTSLLRKTPSEINKKYDI